MFSYKQVAGTKEVLGNQSRSPQRTVTTLDARKPQSLPFVGARIDAMTDEQLEKEKQKLQALMARLGIVVK